MQLIQLVALIALTTSSLGQDLRTLTPAQMEEDLFVLSEELETQHGGLLRYTDRAELDEAFGRTLFACAEPTTVRDFYRNLSLLVSSVRCGHTGAALPLRDSGAIEARRGLLPVEVHLAGERLHVVRSLDGSLQPGDEILAIDGRSIAEIRACVFPQLSSDGFNETLKERKLERSLARYLARHVDETGAGDYVVRIAGRDGGLPLTGLDPLAYGRAATVRPSRPIVQLELPQGEDLGILFVGSFGDPGGGAPTMPEQLAAAFARLAAAGVSNLAVDLRGNGGGNDNYGALLVSYLTDQPFGYFERIEVTPDYAGPGEVAERDGFRLMLSHDGLAVQPPSENNFQGDVYMLIDGWTFSTAADVATVAHHNGLATFVGEETGGGYDGNTSGVSQRIVLPHSGISVSVPRWMYTTKNLGHAYPGRGVPVDHPVVPTIEDVLAGRDPGLATVRSLIAAD